MLCRTVAVLAGNRKTTKAKAMAIETVKQRSKLTPRREPYWQTLSTGRHVGYRSTSEGGSWIARYYDPGTRKRVYNALTEVCHLPASEQFSDASKRAREWFKHLDKGGNPDTVTVREACARYVAWQRKKKGDKVADDSEVRFRRYVNEDEIAGVPVNKLTPRHVEAWQERLINLPKTKQGPNPKPDQRRANSTVNRDMVCFRAALNRAKADGLTTSDFAWAEALKPLEEVSNRRTLYLSRDERRALIEVLPSDAAGFVRGMCLLPLRPGALAGLKVGDYDKRAGNLAVPTDKAGAGRTIGLPKAAVELLNAQCKDKLPSAHLFTRADGSAWNKDAWKRPIGDGAKAAGLDSGVTAYTFRHSVITDLVDGGLDSLTVAALSGTSVRMIEKHYYKLREDRARDALAGLVL